MNDDKGYIDTVSFKYLFLASMDVSKCGSASIYDMKRSRFLSVDVSNDLVPCLIPCLYHCRAVGELVDNLLDDTRKPSPREPIHLTLPSAQQEEEEEVHDDKYVPRIIPLERFLVTLSKC